MQFCAHTFRAALCCALCSSSVAQEAGPALSGYVTLASDYRHRGLSESGGQPSVQLGGDYQHRSGFFAGAWAAQVEYQPSPVRDSSGRLKLGSYAGYSRTAADWSWVASAARYVYPGTSFDYDYTELAGSASYGDRLFFTASYTDDWYARGASAVYAEIGGALPLPRDLELSATLGRLQSTDLDLRYWNRNIGLSKVFPRGVGVDLRYYDQGRYYSNAIARTDGDAWVLSLSYGFGPR